jgi:hypothetical protein
MPDYDGNTNQKALRIWDYFYKNNNPDVKVVELKKHDSNYRDFIGYHGVDEDVIHLFNSRFYMEPREIYYLEANTEDFFDEIDNPKEVLKTIKSLGEKQFNTFY